MSFLKNLREKGVEVKVQVSNRNVIISGRKYDVSHIVVVGLSEMNLVVSEGDLSLEGKIDGFPLIEKISPDAIKVKRPGEDLPQKLYTIPLFEKEEFYLDNMMLKFEEDNGKVVVKLGDKDFIRLNGIKVVSKVPTYLNIVLMPYIIGTLWFHGPLKVTLRESRKLLEIDVAPK